MPPFLGPFSSLARFALTGYLPIITPWEGYGVNPVLNNQTGFTTKNPFSEIREKRLVRASGWAQAARRALEYVQVRQAKYQGMSPPTARRGQGPRAINRAKYPPPILYPSYTLTSPFNTQRVINTVKPKLLSVF